MYVLTYLGPYHEQVLELKSWRNRIVTIHFCTYAKFEYHSIGVFGTKHDASSNSMRIQHKSYTEFKRSSFVFFVAKLVAIESLSYNML